ncbi:N-6 DNA methylase [Streptomyces sp. HNM0575]|uniref:Eco57I restriction-modification methylase domain-containing protein n=1 Tax=Streptomyces sp. HNM0575 TaxID=2716338 RepID=UPI00145CC69C|nr:Eco57I restriction-modification methylase domain-containing protein [Streptomyces sp. HNM0575]NLU74431.1 N-6 DNA methylase [Streptomyces sp. HNM0575]
MSKLSPESLTERTEARRVARSNALDAEVRASLGQYFTPSTAATLITSLPSLPESGVLRVLDPGAGVGNLAAALVARAATEAPELKLDVTTFEIDEQISSDLTVTLDECADTHSMTCEQHTADFITWAAAALTKGSDSPQWDLVVMNPPYRKINSKSAERGLLESCGIETSNLYTAFVALALRFLAPEGQLVAITPRSFANGSYFRKFRHDLLRRTRLRHIHVFERRDKVFSDSEVLQENVIFHTTVDQASSNVIVSVSRGYEDRPVRHSVPYEQVVDQADPQQFIHIATNAEDLSTAGRMARLPATMRDLGVQVSTGRVVDFRTKENLLREPEKESVPLLYPVNLSAGRVVWPVSGSRKPQALAFNEDTRPLVLPSGAYCLAKRFSAKEEPRRVTASLLLPDDLHGEDVAIENHINVFHQAHHGLDPDLAAGLTAYLNSSVVDQYVRIFSGHTQINAGDLRSLKYPSLKQLKSLGVKVGPSGTSDMVDAALAEVVPELDLGRADAAGIGSAASEGS